MKTRDEYVRELKQRLDRWNTDVDKWEAQLKSAKAGADKRLHADLEKLRDQREKALYNLKLLEGASASAWGDFMKGADAAWDSMAQSIEKARTHFEKQPRSRA